MALHSDNTNLTLDRIFSELKQIGKKLEHRKGPCRGCGWRNQTIKQLKVEKVALLKYIKELETFMKLQTEEEK